MFGKYNTVANGKYQKCEDYLWKEIVANIVFPKKSHNSNKFSSLNKQRVFYLNNICERI